MKYHIASTDKADTDDGGYPLFWSPAGWTDVKDAASYTDEEMRLYSLPLGGVWCTEEDVRYLADDTRGES